jgi:hypothetical protein
VVDLRNKTAKVAIDSLGYILVAYIDRTKLTSAQPPGVSVHGSPN